MTSRTLALAGCALTACQTDGDPTPGSFAGPPAITTASATDDEPAPSSGRVEPSADVAPLDVGMPSSRCTPELQRASSYIWIANSEEGTVSKINTETMIEEGRYLARPDGQGDPSRTSVNFNGDVVVANRLGGITAIAAVPERCPDPEATSRGPSDIREWPDGCVLWHRPMSFDSQRPVAWTQGRWDAQACQYTEMAVWTSGHDLGTTTAEVFLLDGSDGTTLDRTTVGGLGEHVFGFYGGVVDDEGGFWATEVVTDISPGRRLAHIDLEMNVRELTVPLSAYGIAIDHHGDIWLCAREVTRIRPDGSSQLVAARTDGQQWFGCMADGERTLYLAYAQGVDAIDLETGVLRQVFAAPDRDDLLKGISIDAHGLVWSPSKETGRAYRIDPQTGEAEVVDGLVEPYTYSDMTGFALRSVSVIEG